MDPNIAKQLSAQSNRHQQHSQHGESSGENSSTMSLQINNGSGFSPQLIIKPTAKRLHHEINADSQKSDKQCDIITEDASTPMVQESELQAMSIQSELSQNTIDASDGLLRLKENTVDRILETDESMDIPVEDSHLNVTYTYSLHDLTSIIAKVRDFTYSLPSSETICNLLQEHGVDNPTQFCNSNYVNHLLKLPSTTIVADTYVQ
jgi:hypothetical protein